MEFDTLTSKLMIFQQKEFNQRLFKSPEHIFSLMKDLHPFSKGRQGTSQVIDYWRGCRHDVRLSEEQVNFWEHGM